MLLLISEIKKFHRRDWAVHINEYDFRDELIEVAVDLFREIMLHQQDQ